MTDQAPPPAVTPVAPHRRWLVTLSRPALLFGEWVSPSHPHVEVDDDGLAGLGDAVATKTEIAPAPAPDAKA